MIERRIPLILILIACGTWCGSSGLVQDLDDASVLPFPPAPMESVVKPRLQDSTMNGSPR